MLLVTRFISLRLIPPVLIMLLGGCGGNSTPPNSPSTPPNSPNSSQHLYVTNSAGQILQFALPLTSTSTPSLVVSNPTNPLNFAIAVDSNGNLATADGAGHLAIYLAPISASSTPVATFNNGTPGANDGGRQYLVFDAAGDLFATTGTFATLDQINFFKQPLSSASTVSQVITNPNVSTMFDMSTFTGITVDANGNLIVTGLSACSTVTGFFPPPYTSLVQNGPGGGCGFELEFGALTVSNSQLFVAASTGFVAVSPLPFPSGATAKITVGLDPAALAVDSAGNLYVADGFDNTIRVFAPPLANSSVPIVTLSLASTIGGIALGK